MIRKVELYYCDYCDKQVTNNLIIIGGARKARFSFKDKFFEIKIEALGSVVHFCNNDCFNKFMHKADFVVEP